MTPEDLITQPAQRLQSREEPERLYAAAGTTWRIMLSIGVAISGLAVAAGAYMLVMTFLNLNLNHTESGSPQSLNRTELSRVANGINDRKSIFMELQAGTSTIADPSK